MMILKNLMILKKQTEDDCINKNEPIEKIDEVNALYTRVLAALIEEGVVYDYVEDSDKTGGVIYVNIDNQEFTCPDADLKEVLKDRYEMVMGKSFSGNKKKRRKNDNASNNEVVDAIKELSENLKDKKKEPPKESYIPPKIEYTETPIKKAKNYGWAVELAKTLFVGAVVFLVGFFVFTKTDFGKQAYDGMKTMFTEIKHNDKIIESPVNGIQEKDAIPTPTQ